MKQPLLVIMLFYQLFLIPKQGDNIILTIRNRYIKYVRILKH